MEDKYNITDAELEIMKILWENKQISLNQIMEELRKNEHKNKNTIKTLLYRLIEKGAVKSISKNKKENEFKAIISKEKYLRKANQSFLDKLYNGNTSNMLLNFVENKEISKDELKKLIEIIED